MADQVGHGFHSDASVVTGDMVLKGIDLVQAPGLGPQRPARRRPRLYDVTVNEPQPADAVAGQSQDGGDEIERDQALNGEFVSLRPEAGLACGAKPRGNLVIEGDNFDALRWLRMTMKGRVKCIYIDPPYNTGNKDWVYNDHYVGKDDRFRDSAWLEFLYRRLTLARDLLAEDGVILVSINDENRAKLELLMDQVFPGMRVGSLVWRTRNGSNADQVAYLSIDHEHVLVYAAPGFSFGGNAKNFDLYTNPDNDPRGDWQPVSLRLGFSYRERPNLYYPLLDPETGISYPPSPDRVWVYATRTRVKPGQRLQKQPMEDLIAEGKVVFPKEQRVAIFSTKDDLLAAIDCGDVPTSAGLPMLRRGLPDLDYWVGRPVGFGTPRLKLFKDDLRRTTKPLSSWIGAFPGQDSTDDNVIRAGSNTEGARSLKSILGEKSFNFPKPPSLIRELLRQATDQDSLVLDFFAGSGTTAEAVMALNAEDGGRRRFILVSSTEATADEPSRNICRDVCAERVRRLVKGAPGRDPLPGDFTYATARTIAFHDLAYDLPPEEVWLAVQMIHGLPASDYDPNSSVQIAWVDHLAIAYVNRVTPDAVDGLDRQTMFSCRIVYSWSPGRLTSLQGCFTELRALPDELVRRFQS